MLVTVWWLAMAASVPLALTFSPLLVLPVLVAAGRGAAIAVAWCRVLRVRSRRDRGCAVTVIAAVPRNLARSRGGARRLPWASHVEPDGDVFVPGRLSVTERGWVWRPRWLDRADFDRVTLPLPALSGVRFSPTNAVGMPPAAYLHLTTRSGDRADLLVWDYERLLEPSG